MNYVTINSIDDLIKTLNVFLRIPLGHPNERETACDLICKRPWAVSKVPVFSRNFYRTQLTNFFMLVFRNLCEHYQREFWYMRELNVIVWWRRINEHIQ